MGKEKKIYYKRPTKASDGNIYFDKQRLVVKTPELEAACQLAFVQLSEAKPHTLIHRMGIGFIEDEHYNKVRKEINFIGVPERDPNDYLAIYNDEDQQMFILRPASCRMMDTLQYEEWEKEEKKKFDKQQEEEAKNFGGL